MKRTLRDAFDRWKDELIDQLDADIVRAPAIADALEANYIFFSEQIFVSAFHMPPAFAQSSAFFAAVTSPAKAGAVKANAMARANVEMRLS